MIGHFLEALRTTFDNRVNQVALTHRGRHYSYGELDAQARRFAARLVQLGVGQGDRVALCTADKLALLAAHLGTLYAGGVSLPLNPRFTAEELRYFLADSGCRVAVAGPEQRAIIEGQRATLPELWAVVADAAVWHA